MLSSMYIYICIYTSYLTITYINRYKHAAITFLLYSLHGAHSQHSQVRQIHNQIQTISWHKVTMTLESLAHPSGVPNVVSSSKVIVLHPQALHRHHFIALHQMGLRSRHLVLHHVDLRPRQWQTVQR